MPAEHLQEPGSAAASALFERLGVPALVAGPGGQAYTAYELPVPQRNTEGAAISPPYVGVQIHPNPDVNFANRRALVPVEASVVAIGPEERLPTLEALAAEIDRRLERWTGTAPNGAIVLSCTRTTHLRYPDREGERTYWHVGGMYYLEIV